MKNQGNGGAVKKIDFKKELKHLYKPSAKEPAIVEVPKMNFVTIEGQGDPNTSKDFQEAIEALYAVSYSLKFMVKKGELQIDYGVMPLEGLWWAEEMADFSLKEKNSWKWRLMIMQPDFVSEALVTKAMQAVEEKKNPPALAKMKFESYDEGKAAQILHVGPFSEEGPTVARLHRFIEEKAGKPQGLHHEIYLSDIRRAAPEKLKTVLRQPFR